MGRNRVTKTQDMVLFYTIQHWTMQQIGDHFGMSRAAVSKRLKKWGIRISEGEWVNLECEFCGKAFQITRARWRNSIKHFCSQPCYMAALENPGYHPWRAGQRLARAIVSQYFTLQEENVTHHKDGDNRNNDRSNLAVYKSQSDHMKYHRGGKALPVWDGASI